MGRQVQNGFFFLRRCCYVQLTPQQPIGQKLSIRVADLLQDVRPALI